MPSFLLIYLRADFQLKVGVGYREKKFKGPQMQYLIVIQVNFTVNKMKLVKPQVSEAVALPQIYADPIQHKELFKYSITHFLDDFIFEVMPQLLKPMVLLVMVKTDSEQKTIYVHFHKNLYLKSYIYV